MGPAAQKAVPGLIHILTDPNVAVRRAVVKALEQTGLPEKINYREVSLDLAKAIKHQEAAIRRTAVMTLEKISPEAKTLYPALPTDLVTAIKDKDAVVRLQATVVLGRFAFSDRETVLPAFLEALGHDDVKVQDRAKKNWTK
jgi:HEAT repeat protein